MEIMDIDFTASGMERMEQRLVHLDLKGAPPKISYYEQLFPLLSRWGATGLLVEYEDMFPYWGEIKELASNDAYSVEEIAQLQDLAQKNNLTVIPLVQTFGHFEFVLKHEKFHHLREITQFPLSLCPLKEDSLPLLGKMISQIMELHPQSKLFHIGADEVFHLGMCSQCQDHMKAKQLSTAHLFFWHIQRVLNLVRDQWPTVRCIMWDDMFRSVDLHTLKASGITSLVEPMVWVYTNNINLPEGMWDRYAEVFDTVWAASAFKGATGPCMYVTDIGYHVENHKAWLNLLKTEIRAKVKNFGGFCVTGWQRYDHYAVLCELLPVGLPSLAVCLITLREGSFTEKAHIAASTDLKFKELIPLSPFTNAGLVPDCDFPGSGIYIAIQTLLQLKDHYKAFVKNDRMKGWMSAYHVRCNYANPVHIEHFLPVAKQLLEQYLLVRGAIEHEMSLVFPAETITEWTTCYLASKIDKLTQTVRDAEGLVAIGARPKELPNDLGLQIPD